MHFDDPAIRAAYRRGALDACESGFDRLPGPELRAIEEWLSDLEAWHEGDPPPPPYAWASPPS